MWHAVIATTKRQSEIKSYLYDVTAFILSMEEPIDLTVFEVLSINDELKKKFSYKLY